MNVVNLSAESTPKIFLNSNVVTGVLQDQAVLTSFIAELHSLGVIVIEILQGDEGLSFLEKQEHSIRGMVDFFLGDLETDMRRIYAAEIRLGRVIFGIPVSSEDKEKVIELAKSHHASAIAFFGKFISENIDSAPAVKDTSKNSIAKATSGIEL